MILVLAGVCASCTSSTRACAPGQQVSCPCAGGGQGVQVCRDDGSAYGPCSTCSTPTDAATDAPIDAARDTGTDTGDAGVDAPTDVVQAPDADVVTSDVPSRDAALPVDVPTSPICAVSSPSCEFPPGAGIPGACCAGTVCDTSRGTPRCCTEGGHACNIDSDCCDGTEVCNAAGTCSPAPGCRNNGQPCGPGHPEVTGCCSAGAICDTTGSPTLCCEPTGTACHADGDCCLNLTCGADGMCHAPSCVPTNNFVECSMFRGLPCCDVRLSCSVPSVTNPTAHCCAPSGTHLGPGESPSVCCGPGVMTLPDGSRECSAP